MLTALDLIKLNSSVGALIEEVAVVAPELGIIPAEMIEGTTVEVSVRVGLPTVEFRNANEGVSRSKSTFDNKVFQTYIVDHQVAVDDALAQGSKNPGELFADHSIGVIRASLQLIGEQTYYGNPSASDKGFPGLIAQAANDAAHVVDATGTTAKTSVWGLSMGRDGAKFIFGGNRTLTMDNTWRKETVNDGTKQYTGQVNNLTGRIGFKLANKNNAFRIKNVGTDSGKGLTTALLADMVLKAQEAGTILTHIFLTPRSLNQYWKSLQAVSTTGGVVPRPTEFEGIPFVITNSISNAE